MDDFKADTRHACDRFSDKTEELESFFSSNLELFCITDMDGTLLRVNNAWQSTLGYPEKYLQGQKTEQFIHPDDIAHTQCEMARLVDSEAVVDLINRYRCADNTYRYLEWRSCAYRGKIYWAARDITERIVSENLTKKIREFLEEAQQIALIGSWERDYQTNSIYWSDECYRMFGFDKESYVPTDASILEISFPQDREIIANARAESINGKDYLEYEYRIIRPDGGIRYIHATRRTYYDKAGKALRSMGTMHDITERKLIEIEMQKTKANLEEAQSIAHIGSWERDYRTDMHFWSDECYRIFGVDKNSFKPTYETIMSLRHPDDQATIQQIILDTSVDNKYSEFEYRIIRPDGEIRYIHSTRKMFYDEAGNPVRAIGINQDITEQKLAQMETNRIREFFEEAQSNAHIGIWERDLRTDAFYWSDEAYRIYGMEKGSFIPTSEAIMRLRHPEDREKAQRAIAESIHGKEYLEHDYRIVRPNGEIRYIHATRKTYYDETGAAIRGLGTIQDVTANKLSEMEFQRIQRNLEEAQSAAHIGSWERDLTKNEMLWSDETYRIHGLDPKGPKITYQAITAMRHPDDAERVNALIQETYQGKDFTEYEYRITRPDGELRHIHVTRRTHYDKSGKALRAVGSIQDITERKTTETQIREANQKLNRSVNELEVRTREMKQISDMGELLQSCQTLAEVCAIGAQYLQVLYPQSRGAIYLINPSKDLVEANQMWGAPTFTNEVFMPSECWSIRRNRPHRIDKAHPGLLCGHITGSNDLDYLCVPMMAHGEFIGVVHINSAAEDQPPTSARMQSGDQANRLVMEIAEHVAMALSNLNLREALRQQSIRDSLTGLYNRRYMEATLERELHRAARENKPVGIMMFDIDHFKNFNDLSGHDAGDAMLRELGAFLNKSMRGGDIVCRYGGEEFVAVLPGATLEDTRKRAEYLRQGVKELLVYHLGQALGVCTISIGVSAFPDHGLTSEMVLKNADNALYRAKNEGRDRVVVL